MSRLRITYRCNGCATTVPKWVGRCPSCGEWNSLVEEQEAPADPAPRAARPAPAVSPVPIGQVPAEHAQPFATGVAELDRVLGGGFVPGSVTLLGGEPGVGKSTLLLQVIGHLARRGERCLLVAAEESPQQVRLRAERLETVAPNAWVVAATEIDEVEAHIEALEPRFVIVDSIQAVSDPELGAAAGSVTQVRACAHRLVRVAKERTITTVLVGHVTKDGTLAGPRILEHLVDTVLAFGGDRHQALRLLRTAKHRFGATTELGLFEMSEAGLSGVPDAGHLFLSDRRPEASGSLVAPILDGKRPLLVELQALVMPAAAGLPRRSTQGIDASRLAVLLAVLERRAGVRTSASDVYAVGVGGARVDDPGADLALALAVASEVRGQPVAADVVACGEVGLGGELRQVPQLARRLNEAARLGFRRAIVPASSAVADAPLQLHPAATLAEARALATNQLAGGTTMVAMSQ